jgi:hypothetical protein
MESLVEAGSGCLAPVGEHNQDLLGVTEEPLLDGLPIR